MFKQHFGNLMNFRFIFNISWTQPILLMPCNIHIQIIFSKFAFIVLVNLHVSLLKLKSMLKCTTQSNFIGGAAFFTTPPVNSLFFIYICSFILRLIYISSTCKTFLIHRIYKKHGMFLICVLSQCRPNQHCNLFIFWFSLKYSCCYTE